MSGFDNEQAALFDHLTKVTEIYSGLRASLVTQGWSGENAEQVVLEVLRVMTYAQTYGKETRA